MLLTSASYIYNMNFTPVLRFHQNTNADITMVYNIAKEEVPDQGVVIETAENGLIEDISLKPVIYQGSKVSNGALLMEKRVFVEMVRSTYEHGGTDRVRLLDGFVLPGEHGSA